ncbi:MAG: cytochrome c3 family protein [bacterium]
MNSAYNVTIRVTIVAAILAVAVSAEAGVTDSVHDLRGELGIDEICVVCHTPHNAVDPTANDLSYAPLWNHESTSGSYTLYDSATLNFTPGQPDGVTKLCLSCHDGSVAVDNYGGTTSGTLFVDDAVFDGLPGQSVGAGRDFGTNLDNDHPVSFLYDPVAAVDPEIRPSSSPTPVGGTIATDLLVAGKVQCSSCHDVHDVNSNDWLLVVDNAGSSLCLTCHDK